MFLSMLIMVTRNRYVLTSILPPLDIVLTFGVVSPLRPNRYLAWPSILFGITTLINEHPVRSDTKSLRGWSNLGYIFHLFFTNDKKTQHEPIFR
jgi:hypothetical protein